MAHLFLFRRILYPHFFFKKKIHPTVSLLHNRYTTIARFLQQTCAQQRVRKRSDEEVHQRWWVIHIRLVSLLQQQQHIIIAYKFISMLRHNNTRLRCVHWQHARNASSLLTDNNNNNKNITTVTSLSTTTTRRTTPRDVPSSVSLRFTISILHSSHFPPETTCYDPFCTLKTISFQSSAVVVPRFLFLRVSQLLFCSPPSCV